LVGIQRGEDARSRSRYLRSVSREAGGSIDCVALVRKAPARSRGDGWRLGGWM